MDDGAVEVWGGEMPSQTSAHAALKKLYGDAFDYERFRDGSWVGRKGDVCQVQKRRPREDGPAVVLHLRWIQPQKRTRRLHQRSNCSAKVSNISLAYAVILPLLEVVETGHLLWLSQLIQRQSPDGWY